MGHQVGAKIPSQTAQGKLRHARNLLLSFPATHREAGHAQLVRNLLLSPVKFKPELCKLIPRHVAESNTTRSTMSRREISLRNKNWGRAGATWSLRCSDPGQYRVSSFS
jgi:hypothetical protein